MKKSEAKDWARENVTGIWTTPTIPFTPDLKLDETGIRKNVDRIIADRADGVGFGFSEPWVLSLAERKRAMEVSVDAIGKRVHSYVHTTDHSVPETIALTKHAEAIGAEAVMIWAPYEWAKTQDMIAEYFEYVASQTNIPIFAYNTYHSGISMTPETVARISKVPNICALKDAVNDVSHAVRCMELAGDMIVVSDPLEDHFLTMALQFKQQVLLGTTTIFLMQSQHYQPIREYWELAVSGNAAEASKKYYELQPLRDLWSGIYEVLWDKKAALHPLATIKYWMDLIGMAGGPVRPPLVGLTDDQKAAFKEKLEATGWMEKLYPQKAKAA